MFIYEYIVAYTLFLLHCTIIHFTHISHILTFLPKPSYSERIIWFIREYVYLTISKLLANLLFTIH